MENLRIGVVGTGRIANRFVPEARLTGGVIVQGVYNPRYESAEHFAKKWEIACYESIDNLYEDVDAVYVASPHQMHYGYVKDALRHGRHVICEKPMLLKKDQAKELFTYAKKHGQVLFEGIKTAYCPGFERLITLAHSGVIGTIRYIDACFTKLEDADKRELTDREYGGSFTELASYCLLPILKLFGTDYSDIRFEVIPGENGLDLFTKASMAFSQGIATATCGLGVKSEGRLLVAGTKGYVVAEAPWWKTTHFTVHYEDARRVDSYTEEFLGDGLRYEVADFRDKIAENSRADDREKHECKLTEEESTAMAEIMERFLEEQKRGN